MPSINVDVDLGVVILDCSRAELRNLIKHAQAELSAREAKDAGKPPPDDDKPPQDIQPDVGRRELRGLIDRNFGSLSRHALYIARELGV